MRYDASQTTFGQLLKIHFSVAHDPTQFNRQGNDMGRQDRSAIFYADEEQRRIAEAYIRQIDAARVFEGRIVTTLEPLKAFYEDRKTKGAGPEGWRSGRSRPRHTMGFIST